MATFEQRMAELEAEVKRLSASNNAMRTELTTVNTRAVYAENSIRQAVNGNLCAIGIHSYKYTGRRVSQYMEELKCKCGKTTRERIGD